MNIELQEYARATLKVNLFKCTDAQQLCFKRMYSHDDLELPINDVVDKMPDTMLDWAMTQVSNTLTGEK